MNTFKNNTIIVKELDEDDMFYAIKSNDLKEGILFEDAFFFNATDYAIEEFKEGRYSEAYLYNVIDDVYR